MRRAINGRILKRISRDVFQRTPDGFPRARGGSVRNLGEIYGKISLRLPELLQ